MAYPNLLTYKGNGTVQYVSNTEFSALAEVVLEHMVSANSVGLLTTNPASATSIGTFVDNFIVGEPGTTDTTLSSENKVFYQNLDANNIGTLLATPIEWNADQNEIKILDSDKLNALCDEIISYMITNDGPGTYFLGNTAPTDGGTWNQSFAVLDKLSTSTNDTPISYIWEKTQGTTTLSNNVLKLQGSSFKYMSTAEIESLVANVRQRIIDTGIGTYALAESAPVTGTWEARGTIEDSFYVVADGTFIGAVEYISPDPTQVGYAGIRHYWGPAPGPPALFYGISNYFRGVTFYGPTGGNLSFVSDESFVGALVGNTTTESETLTLWRRIA